MTEKKKKVSGDVTVAQNRRARFDFDVEDTFEAGMVLQGTEVKSLRNAGGTISDAWVEVDRGQLYLNAMKIAAYSHGTDANHIPLRRRKLLMHGHEIDRLADEVKKGLQLIPLSIYFKKGRAKVEVAVCRPRKKHDKRAAIKEKDQREELRRATSKHHRGED